LDCGDATQWSRRFRIASERWLGGRCHRAQAKALTSLRSSPQSKTLARCSWTPRKRSKHHGVFASGVLANRRSGPSTSRRQASWTKAVAWSARA